MRVISIVFLIIFLKHCSALLLNMGKGEAVVMSLWKKLLCLVCLYFVSATILYWLA